MQVFIHQIYPNFLTFVPFSLSVWQIVHTVIFHHHHIYISCNFVLHGIVYSSCHRTSLSGDKDGTWRSEILYCNLYIHNLYNSFCKLYIDF